jgi:hypothetical protein
MIPCYVVLVGRWFVKIRCPCVRAHAMQPV